jgi:hypothetical protein
VTIANNCKLCLLLVTIAYNNSSLLDASDLLPLITDHRPAVLTIAYKTNNHLLVTNYRLMLVTHCPQLSLIACC